MVIGILSVDISARDSRSGKRLPGPPICKEGLVTGTGSLDHQGESLSTVLKLSPAFSMQAGFLNWIWGGGRGCISVILVR